MNEDDTKNELEPTPPAKEVANTVVDVPPENLGHDAQVTEDLGRDGQATQDAHVTQEGEYGAHKRRHRHHRGHDHDHDDEVTFVEDPQFEIDYKGDCAYEVKVTIPVANEKQEAAKVYETLAEETELPGFRRGKAPRRLLERKFSKAVRGEVSGKLVTAAFQKLIKDKSLKPLKLPDVEGLEKQAERKDDEPLTFTLKFDVAPRVELSKYRGIQVERPVVTVNAEDVQEAMDELRNRAAVYETLEGGVAAHDDQAVISFKGTIDGNEFPGGSSEDYPYVLGSGRVFPEFEKALLGAAPGDNLSCEVTFPSDYFNPVIQGKTATFAITVKEVKRRRTPELNDDFAKQSGCKNLEQLRQVLEGQLRARSAAQSDAIAESRALKAIMDASSFEISKAVIASAVQDVEEREVRRLMSMRIPMDKIEERRPEIRKSAEETALADVKTLTLLTEIAEAEGIEVTGEDYEREIESVARQSRVRADMLAQYVESEGQRGLYEGRVLRVKAMALVMSHAEITDKEVPRDEVEDEAKQAQE